MFLCGRNDRRNEAIPPSGHGLNKSWGFGVVLKNLADLADCTPDAVVCIEKNIIAPNPGHNFVAAN